MFGTPEKGGIFATTEFVYVTFFSHAGCPINVVVSFPHDQSSVKEPGAVSDKRGVTFAGGASLQRSSSKLGRDHDEGHARFGGNAQAAAVQSRDLKDIEASLDGKLLKNAHFRYSYSEELPSGYEGAVGFWRRREPQRLCLHEQITDCLVESV